MILQASLRIGIQATLRVPEPLQEVSATGGAQVGHRFGGEPGWRNVVFSVSWVGYGHMGVSENRGTPKSSILIGFSIINYPFWGTPIFGNTHIFWRSVETWRNATNNLNTNWYLGTSSEAMIPSIRMKFILTNKKVPISHLPQPFPTFFWQAFSFSGTVFIDVSFTTIFESKSSSIDILFSVNKASIKPSIWVTNDILCRLRCTQFSMWVIPLSILGHSNHIHMYDSWLHG